MLAITENKNLLLTHSFQSVVSIAWMFGDDWLMRVFVFNRLIFMFSWLKSGYRLTKILWKALFFVALERLDKFYIVSLELLWTLIESIIVERPLAIFMLSSLFSFANNQLNYFALSQSPIPSCNNVSIALKKKYNFYIYTHCCNIRAFLTIN